MITERSQLIERTYQRDGEWYTLAVIDRTNQVERLATEEEIAGAAGIEVPAVLDSVEAAVASTSEALRESSEPTKRKPGRPRKEG